MEEDKLKDSFKNVQPIETLDVPRTTDAGSGHFFKGFPNKDSKRISYKLQDVRKRKRKKKKNTEQVSDEASRTRPASFSTAFCLHTAAAFTHVRENHHFRSLTHKDVCRHTRSQEICKQLRLRSEDRMFSVLLWEERRGKGETRDPREGQAPPPPPPKADGEDRGGGARNT